jgi:hypothetical protein
MRTVCSACPPMSQERDWEGQPFLKTCFSSLFLHCETIWSSIWQTRRMESDGCRVPQHTRGLLEAGGHIGRVEVSCSMRMRQA